MRNKRVFLILTLFMAVAVAMMSLVIEGYTRRSLDTKIKYSHESGFYDGPIDIEISVGNSYFITYTLDGSDPTIDSARYEGPIHIDDVSDNENIWSMLKETSPGYFNKESIYALPGNPVDKCTIVRASAYDYSGRKVSSSLKEYFIGFKDKRGYEGLYTVCVATEPIYLFEDNVGIYTMGSGMRDFIDSGEADNHDWVRGWEKAREANWFADGRGSERNTTVQVFDENHNLIIDTVCGMRVRGHDSRHDPQKSLGFYAREEYSGSEYFDCDLFKTGYMPHSFVVFNSGDDSDVKLKDYIIHRAEKEAGSKFTTSTFIPCNMFIQGEYWGPMYIMEDLNSDFLSEVYGVDAKNIRLIKGEALKASETITDISTDLDDWTELYEYILNNDMSDEDNYNYVCEKIDIDSFIDYATTEIYIGNSNWRRNNNSAEWRTSKSEKGNPYADGKWRFCLYDVNDSLRDWEEETPAYFKRALDFQPAIRKLARNPEFEKKFRSRVEELKDIYNPDKIEGYISDWRKTMEEPVDCYFMRFADKPGVENETEQEINEIMQFLRNRPEQMDILYEQLFD